MNPLGSLLERREAEDVAAELNAKLGKKITPHMVKSWAHPSRSGPPKAWADALGLQPPPPSVAAATPEDRTDNEPSGRHSETPPRRPPDATIAPTAFQVQAAAQERIAALHVFAGSAVATAFDADGFEHDRGVGGGIGLLWKDKADPIAQAWIAWANEGNRFAQAFVKLMQSGGAGGDLVLGYVALLGGTAYILGHLPDNEATRLVYGRYGKYRTVTPDDAEPAQQRHGGNGAAPAGAADPLGDVAFAAGI